MTLSDFIDANLDVLVNDWMQYARGLNLVDSFLTENQLRDPARRLLAGVAADIREVQSARQQSERSRRDHSNADSAFNLTGRGHADERLAQGFGINDLVAEYRTLRAGVLRQWRHAGAVDPGGFEEMIRFNQALDQIISESITRYTQRTERVRDLFAGVLAHDLRSPVGAILNSTQVIQQDEHLSATSLKAVATAQRSAIRVKRLVDDLFIFARARLGVGLPVETTAQNIGRICEGAVEEVRASEVG